MIQGWQICILVYDYLKKNEYTKSLEAFNDECMYLHIPDPLPELQKCVIESLVNKGDLEARLNAEEELSSNAAKNEDVIARLEKKCRKSRKRKKVDSPDSKQSKIAKPDAKLINDPNIQSEAKDSSMLSQQNNMTNFIQPTNSQSHSLNYSTTSQSQYEYSNLNYSQFSNNSGSMYLNQTANKTSFFGNESTTPEKAPASSSRRKTATPKKLPGVPSFKGKIEALAENINSRNEDAALETLNSVEPWLEQFINSISEPHDEEPELQSFHIPPDNTEEAALSLLALNQSGGDTEQSTNFGMLSDSHTPIMCSQPAPQQSQYSDNNDSAAYVQSTQSLVTPAILLTSSSADLSNAVGSSGDVSQVFDKNAENSSTVNTTSDVSNPCVKSLFTTIDPPPTELNPPSASPTTPQITKCSTPIPQPNFNDTFDPILIKNKKTFSLAKNNPNIDIIVLPTSNATHYQHILPKPAKNEPPSAKSPIPAGYHVSQDGSITAPVYHVLNNNNNHVSSTAPKPSPQQEAQKFFNQARKPYHQQFCAINSMYLVDVSPDSRVQAQHRTPHPPKTPVLSTTKRCGFPTDLDAVPTIQEHYIAPKSPLPSTSSDEKPKTNKSFVSWDAKMRQSIAGNDVPPEPPKEVKKKKKSHKVKPSDNESKDGSTKKKKSKKEKKEKKGKKDKSKKKNKSKDKKDKSSSDLPKKKTITPEFVLDSLSSGPDEDVSSKKMQNNSWESDTMMADLLHKTLKGEEVPLGLPKSFLIESERCSTPKVDAKKVADKSSVAPKPETSLKESSFLRPAPAFIEENANSSFDIDESTRPKPVFVPADKSQNSCSCSSTHFRDHAGKPFSGKSFTFQEDEVTDSPKYYNDESAGSVTVASLFPVSSASNEKPCDNSNSFADREYRTRKVINEDTDGDDDEDRLTEDEERETTSNLPPISSQNKDLLESSDEEREERAEPKNISVTTSVSVLLSESDNESFSKLKSPIKAAKLASPRHDSPENVSTEKLIPVSVSVSICDDLNDSQELSISIDANTNDSNSKTSDPDNAKSSETVSKSSEKENNENKHLNNIPEDSCDRWYSSVTDKFGAKESYVCKNCKKSFPSLAVLNVHAGTCTKTVLVCKLCGKKCSSKSGLSNHLNSCLKPKGNSRERKKTPQADEEKKKENPKIKINKYKISPSVSLSNSENVSISSNATPKKSSKKKKKRLGKQDAEQIDEFLGSLRYE